MHTIKASNIEAWIPNATDKDRYGDIYLNRIYSSNSILINVGIAGGSPSSTKIGNIYYIEKLTSDFFKKEYVFPATDNIIIPKIGLTTVEKNINKNDNIIYKELVDMEAAVITDIAIKYLDLSKIKILKIVSDHMNIMDWSNLNIRKLIQSNIESISSYFILILELTFLFVIL